MVSRCHSGGGPLWCQAPYKGLSCTGIKSLAPCIAFKLLPESTYIEPVFRYLNLEPNFDSHKNTRYVLYGSNIHSIFFFFFFLRATPVAYGSFQARGPIGAAAEAYATAIATPDLSHLCNLHTAHSNARSLTHWAQPGIEAASGLLLLSHDGNSF